MPMCWNVEHQAFAHSYVQSPYTQVRPRQRPVDTKERVSNQEVRGYVSAKRALFVLECLNGIERSSTNGRVYPRANPNQRSKSDGKDRQPERRIGQGK